MVKKNSFVKKHYEQLMPEPVKSHPSGCRFYTIDAAFHLFKFRQEEIKEFTMLMYFHLLVKTCKFSISLIEICRLHNVFGDIFTL